MKDFDFLVIIYLKEYKDYPYTHLVNFQQLNSSHQIL